MMKIAIGVSGGELARYSVFYDSLLHLHGMNHDNVIHAKGANIAENRNGIQQIAQVRGFDAILYLDDDQVLPPDTLLKLQAHLESGKDVVSALYLKREPPFIPHAYHDMGGNRWATHHLSPTTKGMVRVDMTGAGCLMVRMSVFEKIQEPYWTLGQGATKAGWADDEMFCKAVTAAGVEIWVDMDCPIGHQLNGSVWPVKDKDGNWGSALVVGKEVAVVFPAAKKSPNELWS